jgi:integrase
MTLRRVKGEGGLFRVKGSRFWRAQYVHNGKVIRVSTKEKVKARALLILQRYMADAARGLAPLPEAQKLRYADLRRGLIANYEERGNRSLTTYANGEENINGLRQLDEFFNYSESNPGPPLMQITTETSREFARKRQADRVGTAMVNRSLHCLRRMLRIAHEDGLIQHVPKIRFLKEPPPRKGFLELEKFNEVLALLPTHLQPLILLLYYCGLRVDEGCQIEWQQVNLDARLIRLEQEQTKGDEARYAPLPAQLVMLLRAIEPKIGKVFDHTNLRVEWQKACDACGLGKRTLIEPKDGYSWYKYKGLLVHDLRRSAVRNLVNAGVPERVAMQITGHKTRAVFDRYHIVSTVDVTNAMSRLELSSDRSVTVTAKRSKGLSVSNSK